MSMSGQVNRKSKVRIVTLHFCIKNENVEKKGESKLVDIDDRA